jgi:ssDNA-binding Zn-finger/Zn-ribbon topoisomerase 1
MPQSLSQHSSVPPAAIESPECPKCQGPMMLSRIRPRRLNFDARTFECVKCDHVEKVLVATDPMHSDVLGWLLGELRSPT